MEFEPVTLQKRGLLHCTVCAADYDVKRDQNFDTKGLIK